jgi:hypothetical protein
VCDDLVEFLYQLVVEVELLLVIGDQFLVLLVLLASVLAGLRSLDGEVLATGLAQLVAFLDFDQPVLEGVQPVLQRLVLVLLGDNGWSTRWLWLTWLVQ